jgi:hypothetical protein
VGRQLSEYFGYSIYLILTGLQIMLNKDMNKISENQEPQKPAQTAQTPNESGGFDISGVVKIYDPESKEVFVEVRT